MKAPTKHKILIDEEKEEYIALVHANFSSTLLNLQYLGRTTSVPSAYGVLLRELASFTAEALLDAGQDPDEAEETLLKALEDLTDEDEDEAIITNPVPEKEVHLRGGLPSSGSDGRDGAQGGEDIGND
jgi:hypothetical protein